MREDISFDKQEFMALYNASGTRQGLIEALEEMHGYLGEEDAEPQGLYRVLCWKAQGHERRGIPGHGTGFCPRPGRVTAK